MIFLIIAIAWVLMGTVIFRYLGHGVKPRELTGHCPWPSICNYCRCKNCGDGKSYHTHPRQYSTVGCNNYEPTSVHPGDWATAIGLSYLAWWAVIPVWAVKQIAPNKSFFAPAPEIKSREARAKKRLAELEAAIAASEKELGMG